MKWKKSGAKFLLLNIGLLLVLSLFQNCDASHEQIQLNSLGEIEPAPAPYAETEAEIAAKAARETLEKYCSFCHSPGSGVVSKVEDIADWPALVSSGLVVPGDPESSKLFDLAQSGEMPVYPYPMIPSKDVDALYAWIKTLNSDGSVPENPNPPPVEEDPTENLVVLGQALYHKSGSCASCHLPSELKGTTVAQMTNAFLANNSMIKFNSLTLSEKESLEAYLAQ